MSTPSVTLKILIGEEGALKALRDWQQPSLLTLPRILDIVTERIFIADQPQQQQRPCCRNGASGSPIVLSRGNANRRHPGHKRSQRVPHEPVPPSVLRECTDQEPPEAVGHNVRMVFVSPSRPGLCLGTAFAYSRNYVVNMFGVRNRSTLQLPFFFVLTSNACLQEHGSGIRIRIDTTMSQT